MKYIPEVDYRKFRPDKLGTQEFAHLKYLIFWPIWAIGFFFLETVWIRDSYCPVSCVLDGWVPFCEYFIIPYLFWFVFMLGMHVYSLLYDISAFRRMMKFLMISYTLGLLIFILFPNCQNLRAATFERNNLFTAWVKAFYAFDTNTNVCPSLHVIGSVSAVLCGWDSKHFSGRGWKAIFGTVGFLTSVSTVFIKQHSVMDIIVAVPVCLLAWWFAYGVRRKAHTVRIAKQIEIRTAKPFSSSLRADALIAAYQRNNDKNAKAEDFEWFESRLSESVLSGSCTEDMAKQTMDEIRRRFAESNHALD